MICRLVGLLLLGAGCGAPAIGAEWFTIAGDLGDRSVDTVQLDLAALPRRGQIHSMTLRVTFAGMRSLRSGERYASYVSSIAVDCDAESIVHIDQTRFSGPGWDGEKTFQRFADVRPMAFGGLMPNPKAKILKAACDPKP